MVTGPHERFSALTIEYRHVGGLVFSRVYKQEALWCPPYWRGSGRKTGKVRKDVTGLFRALNWKKHTPSS